MKNFTSKLIKLFKNHWLDLIHTGRFYRWQTANNEIPKKKLGHFEIVDELYYMHPTTVLVLSPHIDDDCFGCGGILLKHKKNQDKIHLVYFYDWDLMRRIEAEKVAKKLAAQTYFLKKAKDVFSLIEQIQPKIIYYPSLSDNHPEHFAIARLIEDNINKLPKHCLLAQYEVWSPSYINRLVPISWPDKERLLRIFASQMKDRNYIIAIKALNQYRAEIMGVKGFAEGFLLKKL